MQFEIQTYDIELSEAERTLVERRLRFALSRFQDQVMRIVVRLSHSEGSMGDIDKRCYIQIQLRGLPDIVVRDAEVDLHMAVDRAVKRAERTLGRYLFRRHRDGFNWP